MLLAAIIALNPLGIDAIHAAFSANEALSRNIWGPIVLTGMAIMTLIVLLEWGTRKFIISRRARGTATSS
jgi:hypothetical protein